MKFSDSLPMQLRRAYLTMHRAAQAHFAQLGITTDQFIVLAILLEEDGIIQSELGSVMASDANTITAMLKRLEKQSHICRKACEADGRARRIYLTKSGRKYAEKLMRASEGLRNSIEDSIPVDAKQHLSSSLKCIVTTSASTNRRD